MNYELINTIKNSSNISTKEHSGAYELVQKAVEFYQDLPVNKININDLTMLFRFGINKGHSKDMLDTIIDSSSLLAEQKNTLKSVAQKWQYEKLGIFGSGIMVLQMSKGANKDAVAKNFITMLTDIAKLSNEQVVQMFEIAKKALSSNISGMTAGIASQILHLLKPDIFPVLNKVGQDGYKKKLGLTGFIKISNVAHYADNAQKIYEFKEKYLKGINFRTIDIAFENYNVNNYNVGQNEYVKFKNLLKWFTNQLKINNGIIQGKSTSGTGYKGEKIRDKYSDWRKYDGFELDCTIRKGIHTATTANYINFTGTWLNIIPKFTEDNDIYALQIVLKGEGNVILREHPPIIVEELDILSDNLPNDKLIEFFETYKKEISVHQKKDIKGELKGANKILYGVPGSGKSYTIKKEIATILDIDLKGAEGEEKYAQLIENRQIVRVVFHPDYTYSDFTGQILPRAIEGKVNYQFISGPFTRILQSAINNPSKPYFLVIEEINRGNAAAIFGDLFQLLDRVDYQSEYPIDSIEISKSIYKIESYDTYIPQIYLPKNLWLLATMNTSDQNVYTLDTAFQRRWGMQLIPNEFADAHIFEIESTGVTWRDFAEAINEQLEIDSSITSEDKRLGAWFVKADIGDSKLSKECFANKVLKYLWDDAFKFNRDSLFDIESYPTLEKLIKAFMKGESEQDFLKLFSDKGLFQASEIDNAETGE